MSAILEVESLVMFVKSTLFITKCLPAAFKQHFTDKKTSR